MRGLRQRAGAEPVGVAGLTGTLALHLAVLVSLLAAGAAQQRTLPLPAYRVSLVAAPRPAAAAAEPVASELAPAARPAAEPPAPTPTTSRTPAVPLAPRSPAATTQPPAAAVPPSATAENPRAPAAPAAPAAPVPPLPTAGGTGTDVAAIRTEGVEFPFPGYLRNLVAQVYRRWQPQASGANLEAEIFFFVHRNGTVTGLQFIRRSGSFAFDLEAQGAIEAAARAGAFGSLPDGYGADVLPVSFFFNPRSRE